MNIKYLKEKYQKGQRVECIDMQDAQAVPSGTQGTIQFVDDMGTIHVAWDNGQSLGLIDGEDSFKIVQQELKSYETQFVNLEVNAPLVRKSILEPRKNLVRIAIKLPYSDYYDLLENPMSDRDYIKDHVEEMYQDEDGISHSILVYCDEEPDGIVIESEGYHYARYQGYINNVHELLETQTYASNDYDDRLTKIKVLVIEPQAKPYIAIIDNNLKSLQSMVGGNIELVSLSNTAEIICNEEGKLMNLPANRRLGNDIITGRFIIVGDDGGEHFTSISPEDIKNYSQQFYDIEMIDQSEVQNSMRYEIHY
ncbi:DUF4314 domain-containing protein [Anaerorhabdus sp.]|uniref:DUF3846 domain-containing protein n=1 Tax=Anaerorhabdus sp. TaxID=1872524 RepID=UPI002B20941B|nr:DUF4314 domain-containing protein [Anaerorhabdus sp.]MEA4875655.1 DUF4314 domain-containing protein [Anaerorhabdus sp.]